MKVELPNIMETLYPCIEKVGENPNEAATTFILNAWTVNHNTETIKFKEKQNPFSYAYQEWKKRKTDYIFNQILKGGKQ